MFANVYMNEFDQFVKHELKVKFYARYTDDFVIVADDRADLEQLLPRIARFLDMHLALSLHPDKISIRSYHQGVDFLGYVCLPNRTIVRTKTRRRIFRKMRKRVDKFKAGMVSEDAVQASFTSYLGVLSHADAHEHAENFRNDFYFRMSGE